MAKKHINSLNLIQKEFKKLKYNDQKNILIAILTFIIGFGSTFYIIRTYFPKHKAEKTAPAKDTLTKTEN